jgi:ribonuclease J
VSENKKIKIIPLGGLEEIGKNLTVIEYDDEMIMIDCGVAFPSDEMLGVDLVLPDTTYLTKNVNKLLGILITHGHEDHIGGLPYFLRNINVPVFGTKLTLGLVSLKLKEIGILNKCKLNRVRAGTAIKLGKHFKVEFIRVNHSIADAVAIAVHTPEGIIVHTGDFKIDTTPIDAGEIINLTRFGELGKRGVLALMSDSTNVERSGFAMSEKSVGERFEEIFRNCEQRIIVATFASNIHRVQQIINSAVKHKRKVAVSGRSMLNILEVSTGLGYMKIPEGTIINIEDINRYRPNQLVLITTGSQGEEMSALTRMAHSDHRKVEIGKDDLVILSASPIPGNEKAVSKVINELFKKGADVIYESLAEVHVSGHACKEELKIMLGLVKPKYFIPVHGEYRHLVRHAKLAEGMGIQKKNVFIMELGDVLELDHEGAAIAGEVPSGNVLVDGYGVGDVGNIVLRDRKHLGQDGLIIAVVTLSSNNKEILSGPDIISRGFVYVRESENLMEELRRVAYTALENSRVKTNDWNAMKMALRSSLGEFIYEKTKRKPMILAVLTEV